MPSAFARYLAKRLALFGVTAFAALVINFILPRLMPGDPISGMLAQMSQQGATVAGGSAVVKAYVEEFGLDKDWWTQFVLYMRELFRGNLGVSTMAYPLRVSSLIGRALPWTIGLLLTCVLIAWAAGNVLGAFVGWSQHQKLNSGLVVLSLCLNQIPYYILGLVLVFILGYLLPIFPTAGGYDVRLSAGLNLSFIASVLEHSMLPALSIVIVSIGGWMIGIRSLIVSILGEDYLLFAEAKGLRKNVIMMRYAFRNALLPQVTGLALSLGFIVNGALLTEQIFGYPGIGSLFVTALNYRDYNIMQAVFLMSTFSVLGACVLLDIVYPLVDPRVRYG